MEKKRLTLRAVFALCNGLLLTVLSAPTIADEGMHPISEIGNVDLKSHGCQLTTQQIFNTDTPCLVDGICRVNGCTGSFVSPQGLIITNHHCAYRAIQQSSSTTHDYLNDGFHAAKLSDEIPAKGYVVRVTESFRDVSTEVLSAVNEAMDFTQRTKALERRRKELEQRAETENAGMRAEVAEMFAGRTYVLFLYTYLKDVRLTFAPADAVGRFGGDVDNWEWPRHTGDFSFMRAYTAPDGSSADYSPDNIPYQPKRFIPVAASGANAGDFVMLLGYPGVTARHKTVSFLEYEQNVRLPFVVDLFGKQIQILTAAGENDRAVALKNLSRIQGLANVEKRSRGQLQGLRRAPIIAERQAQEAALQIFIVSEPERKKLYGSLREQIAEVYKAMAAESQRELNLAALENGCQLLSIAHTLYESAVEREKEDLDREPQYMDRNFDQTIKSLQVAQQNFDLATDQTILKLMLERNTLDPQIVDKLDVDQLYKNTTAHQPEFVEQCLNKTPQELAALDDSFMRLAVALHPQYEQLRAVNKAREGELSQLYGELIKVKAEFQKTNFIPDANGTLRLTHGTIRGYSPADAVWMEPATSLGGVIAKTTGVEPFVTPQKIIDLHAAKQWGGFAHPKLNDVPVAILYDTDTTGGNSGSPIINATGQLVGVNFDRTFAATINDFAWNTDYSRSIGVDIRYVLWITQEVFGADNLIKEMGLGEEAKK